MTTDAAKPLTTQALSERILQLEHTLMARDERVRGHWHALRARARRAADARHWLKPLAAGAIALAAVWALRRRRRARPPRAAASKFRAWWPRLLPLVLTLSRVGGRGGLSPATAFALGRSLVARRRRHAAG